MLALAVIASSASGRQDDAPPSAWDPAPGGANAGAPGGPGLALRAAKILTCELGGPGWIDRGVLLVRDGKIERVGPEGEVEVPADYVRLDVGERWLAPGMVDLHCHIAGTFDINDMVYQTNPELRVKSSVIPSNPSFQRALAGGVTTVLYIPGSGTNSGGQGVLVKTAGETWEECLVRDPGSLKIAQWGNPERWGPGVGKTFEAYALRDMFTKGRIYAQAWKDFEEGRGEEPELLIEYEIFRKMYHEDVPASVHTQIYQVVALTITMLKGEFGLNVFTDHSEVGSWPAAKAAVEYGVPTIVGPRSIDAPSRGFMTWAQVREEGFIGLARKWREGGQTLVGFNTDSPVVPQEELFVQSTMAVKFGMANEHLEAVRGLTIIPALVVGIDDRVGSLEVGKEADVLVTGGDPSDPRSAVDMVLVGGRRVYDVSEEQRRF
jgi:imidazolonepropionase-like amidohydrolase